MNNFQTSRTESLERDFINEIVRIFQDIKRFTEIHVRIGNRRHYISFNKVKILILRQKYEAVK